MTTDATPIDTEATQAQYVPHLTPIERLALESVATGQPAEWALAVVVPCGLIEYVLARPTGLTQAGRDALASVEHLTTIDGLHCQINEIYTQRDEGQITREAARGMMTLACRLFTGR